MGFVDQKTTNDFFEDESNSTPSPPALPLKGRGFPLFTYRAKAGLVGNAKLEGEGTSQRRRLRSPLTHDSGISLIEIMVVMVIIGMMVGLGATVLRDSPNRLLEDRSKIIGRDVLKSYQESAASGRYLRMVVDFQENSFVFESSTLPPIFSAEEFSSEKSEQSPVPSENSQEPLSGSLLENSSEKKAAAKPNPKPVFEKVDSERIAQVFLPESIKVKDVWTNRTGKVSSGKVAIYFFPSGWVEGAVINLSDTNEQVFFSIQVQSSTARSKLLPEYHEMELEEENR